MTLLKLATVSERQAPPIHCLASILDSLIMQAADRWLSWNGQKITCIVICKLLQFSYFSPLKQSRHSHWSKIFSLDQNTYKWRAGLEG